MHPTPAAGSAGPAVLDWELVRRRYARPVRIAPVSGASPLTAVVAGEDAITISQRLWSVALRRADLEAAVAALNALAGPVSPIAFAESIRTCTTECSRTPNLCAVVLHDLGLLPAVPGH